MIPMSDELQRSTIRMFDVQREPGVYPKEVVEAFQALADHPDNFTYEGAFKIEGYIVHDCGIVGIRPGSPEHIREEWMKYWSAIRKNPYA